MKPGCLGLYQVWFQVFKAGDCTAFLGSLFCCLTVVIVKKFFLISSWSISYSSVCLLLFILLLQAAGSAVCRKSEVWLSFFDFVGGMGKLLLGPPSKASLLFSELSKHSSLMLIRLCLEHG